MKTKHVSTKQVQPHMHVVLVDDREVGVISRYNRSSAWTSTLGVGMAARDLPGTTRDQKAAVEKVVAAL